MINRRQLLAAGGLATAGLAAAACTPGGSGQPGASTNPTTGGGGGGAEVAAHPSFIPYEGITPDLPALDNGTSPYFKSAPVDWPDFTDVVPGNGGEVRCHTFMNSIPTGKPNQWWEAIEKEVGATIKVEGAAIGDYPSKFQTMVAGGDIADMVAVLPDQVPHLGQVLEATFADLSDHLSGDAIKDFPGLANIPSYTWDACIYGGRIRMIPIHRFMLDSVSSMIRKDVAERLGAPTEPKNGDEYYEMLKTLHVPSEQIFATNSVIGVFNTVAQMMGVPNEWAEEGGAFTKDIETDAYVEALEFMRKVWAEDLIHPNAFDANFSLQTQAMFNTGKSVLGFGSTWMGNATQAATADPEAESSWFPIMKWDGSGPAGRWSGTGAPYLCAIKQGDDERVRELIGISNWFASPWGTKQYYLFRAGVEGHNYEFDADGKRVTIEENKAENMGPLIYMGSSALVHNSDAYPEIAQMEYESEAEGMDHVMPLPINGLESETGQTKNAQLTKIISDGRADIITGRKEVSAWEGIVADWKSKGGDQVRTEYEASLQARG